jgi:hypothetical protein
MQALKRMRFSAIKICLLSISFGVLNRHLDMGHRSPIENDEPVISVSYESLTFLQ